ncbi:Transcription termination/antitermination protein NusG [Buchnera aphidicola (Pterocallis alni)]|uniref:transcription termination/antitermination protein NusG n=1 Tax=Buchnera aphidicola TaxID=9 RepID=UPI0034648ED5
MYDIIKKNWYILQTLSGQENQIVKKIQKNIKNSNLIQYFGEIIVPSEKVLEIKNGKKKTSQCKFFPGYILINMYMNEKSWQLIRNTPKIIGFIGGISERPKTMHKKIINKIINKLNKIGNQTRPKILFNIGERIRINNGPFSGFQGTVEQIDYNKNRLKISVLIFGRSTLLELNFNQIEKNT